MSASIDQFDLPLAAPPAAGEALPLVPARMVNEHVYCPRLAWLEWGDGQWADSGDTEEGRRAHARVDRPGPPLPAPAETEDLEKPFKTHAVTLSCERLGLIAKMDLIEAEDGVALPVDTKKGKRPHVAEGAYEPERVQLCAQAWCSRRTAGAAPRARSGTPVAASASASPSTKACAPARSRRSRACVSRPRGPRPLRRWSTARNARAAR